MSQPSSTISGTPPSPTPGTLADLPTALAQLSVGILGGTGDQGRGLATRFAAAGVSVVIGSRDAARAELAASEISEALAGRSGPGGPAPVGVDNRACAERSGLVVVAVPWAGHAATLVELADALAGKVVVDCVNPLGFDKRGAYALGVPEGSAAQQAAALLPGSTVVAAFHHVSAVLLNDLANTELGGDVLVLGDDREATDLVAGLAGLLPGMRGVFAGRLRNAHQVEALTANLISVNRRYQAHAGIRVTDLD